MRTVSAVGGLVSGCVGTRRLRDLFRVVVQRRDAAVPVDAHRLRAQSAMRDQDWSCGGTARARAVWGDDEGSRARGSDRSRTETLESLYLL